MRTAKTLTIRDVTLRDGLQSLPQVLATADKLVVLDGLMAAGIKDFQLTSFVNPARVPQMGDAEAVFAAGVARGLTVNVLVANLKGFERAVAAGAHSIDAVLSASNTYNSKNANRSTEESAREIEVMLDRTAPARASIGISIANSFHCFSEGLMEPERVYALTRRFHDAGAHTIWISDTTGHAQPDAVTRLIERCRDIGIELGLHLHDTMGRAGDNALAGYRAGIRRFDAALSGLGGSPFTPGVGGNLSLETIAAVFEKEGIAPGFDADKLEPARASLADGIAKASAGAA